MLRAMKRFTDHGKVYVPGDPVELDAHTAELLRRGGWVGEGTPGPRRNSLTVHENGDMPGQYVAPRESNAEREARERGLRP